MKDLLRNNDKISDFELWQQLRLGDEKAFSLLFERYYESMVNYAKTLSIQKDTAKDSVQDVFVDVWNYRYKLSETVIVKTYLLSSVRKRIARLRERDHIFSKTKDADSIDFLFDFSIEQHLIASETMEEKVNQLNRHINALSPRQKEALYLRYHEGLSVEQVSEILDMNYQSTKNLFHRAIVQLRKELPSGSLALLLCFSL